MERIEGIVIDTRKHSERHNIITLYTRTRGRIAFVSTTGNGRAARLRNARLMPLSLVAADITFKENRDLQTLGKFETIRVPRDIYFNPYKSAMAMFLSEFLNRLLRSSMPDNLLWDFIADSIEILDIDDRVTPDFHIIFLISILSFVGIQPDLSGLEEGTYFDMRAGACTIFKPSHPDWLSDEKAALAQKLQRINFRNASRFRLNAETRNLILDELLKYYAIHVPGTATLRSLDVLRQLFH